jgi:Fe-S-cluster containining protein
MGRLLPVVANGTYRQYPTQRHQQGPFEREQDVCGHCLAGSCCSSEHPIALTSFDVLRLALLLDLSPVAFLQAFTQDRFAGHSNEDLRRGWIEDDNSSVVTFLRRRSNVPTSPCIFLKYIREAGGLTRRVCSVHPARPLACREYYYDTCKKRVTGELAAAHATGFEMLRDGAITAAEVDSANRALGSPSDDDTLSTRWQRAFWLEMRRALDVAVSNEEGAAGFAIAGYQDPIDVKVNRLLSKRHVRFEEKYGPFAHREQLDDFQAGTSFSATADRARLLRIIHVPPRHGLFDDRDYAPGVGLRTLLPGLSLASSESRDRSLPRHAASIARGWGFLAAVAEHASRTGGLLELAAEGTLELAFLEAVIPFSVSLQRTLTGRTPLDPAKQWAAGVVLRSVGARYNALRSRGAGEEAWLRLYRLVSSLDGTTTTPALATLIRQIKRTAAAEVRPPRQKRTSARGSAPRRRDFTSALARSFQLRASAGLVTGGWQQAAWALELLGLEFLVEDPTGGLEILEQFVHGGARLRPPLRRSIARLALKWATARESQAAWTSDLMLRWPALCVALGIAGSATPGWDTSLVHLRHSQAADGSWGTDLTAGAAEAIGSQGDYLLNVIRTTSGALVALCFEHAEPRA